MGRPTTTPGGRNGGRPGVVWMAAVVVFTFVAQLNAGMTVSLPYDGRFRAGHFMPVRVTVTGVGGELELHARGAMPTWVAGTAAPVGGEMTVPMLMVSESAKELVVGGAAPVGLRVLGEDERLVGFAGADVGAGKALFPGATLIAVRLDLTGPLLDPPLAWEGLDAVVLSPAARARLSDAQTGVLVSAGVALVVVGEAVPDRRWPWERSGGGAWVLRHRVAGPASAVAAGAYAPTYTWDRGVPGRVRRQVVWVAAVFCICAALASLWRSRRAAGAVVGLCVLTAAGVGAIYMRSPPRLLLQKTIAVRGDRLTQYDDWAWHASLGESRSSMPAYQLTVPVFASSRQVEVSGVRLECDARGKPLAYVFRTGLGESLAFVTRDVLPSFEISGYAPAVAPWGRFATDLYAMPGDRLAGEAQIAAELSATVVERADGR